MTTGTLLVVDVGNTRIKWGRCDAAGVIASVSLPPDDVAAWQQQLDTWNASRPLMWAVAGVHPARRDRLANWLRQRGDQVALINSPTQLPLRTALDHPEYAGIDRLLNAVAVNKRRRPDAPAVIIDAGSAVTVDYVDKQGTFCGGAILPGLRLMAQALHDYTALLPVVEVVGRTSMPGTSTLEALHAGILAAVAGGTERLIDELPRLPPPQIFLGGGDAALLASVLSRPAEQWPLMTLEGLRSTAALLA